MSTEQPEEVTVVVEGDEDGATGASDTSEAAADSPRFRFRRTWAEMRSGAPFTVFGLWAACVALVAMARIDPWNEWRSWRKWLRADERGWELLIPGLLGVGATWLIIKGHDRWSDEGWSPEVTAMVLLSAGTAFGAVLWGLYCLDLRPFAG